MVLTTEKPEVAPVGAASAPGAVKLPKKKRPKGWWLPFALIAPAIVFELLIHVIPMAVGIWMSFLKLTQFYIANWGAARSSGLANYQIAINFNGAQGQALLSSFLVTCGFTILVVGISWVLGMAAAVALQKAFRGRAIFRTMFLIPYAVPVFAGIITWKFMFQQNTGVINQILGGLHLIDPNNPPFWLIGNNAFIAMVIVAIWKLWPFAFLMLMAGLQTINEDLYEAASLDGAKPFGNGVTSPLPGLGAVNNVLLLVLFLWTFNDFNTPFILFGGAEPPAGDLVSFHIYNTSFITLNFGFGSAMSVLLLLFLMLVSALYLAFINRRSRRA